ncbi:MAG TPA: hypothetical protein VEA58_10850 [Anaerovoracaceae bacterium]|nr:hypothetical protein [Anaerovoracaceae bacterium]
MVCKHQDMHENGLSFNFEQINILSLFQRLWTQLAVFMRAYINTAIDRSPRAEYNAERLLAMSSDFRNTFLLFYGPELADRFNDLFTSFTARSTNVIEGFLSNNQDLINQSVRDWYNDANQLANFLASINLYWDENQWRNLLYQYIQLKLQMITSLISGDYRREIQIYDRIFDLTTTIGSYMARGLIAQQSHDIEQ